MLARPIHAVGDAEGTARGAAVLGLFALGRAPTLTGAEAELSDAAVPSGQAIERDPRLVAAYDRLRATVPEFIGALDSFAGFFRSTGAPAW
jgi:gluconokinase